MGLIPLLQARASHTLPEATPFAEIFLQAAKLLVEQVIG